MLVVGAGEAIAGELVDSGVLVELEFRVGDAAARDDLDVDLDALTGVRHLLIRLGDVLLLPLLDREHAESAHDSVERFHTAGITTQS